jgi:hypothetical protein
MGFAGLDASASKFVVDDELGFHARTAAPRRGQVGSDEAGLGELGTGRSSVDQPLAQFSAARIIVAREPRSTREPGGRQQTAPFVFARGRRHLHPP